MKNPFAKFLFASMALAATISFTACGGDDDDDNTPSDNTGSVEDNSVITTPTGEKLLLASVGKYSFRYNENGLPIAYGDCYVDYDKGIIYEDDVEFKFSLNNKGYITTISYSYKDFEDYASGEYKFSYNDAGQLTKVSGTSEEGYNDGEDSYSASSSGSMTYTWSNGLLTSVVIEGKGSEVEDAEKYNWSGKDVFKLTYSEPNPMGQHSYGLSEAYDFDIAEGLRYFGMFGVAPVKFVDTIENSWTANESGEVPREGSITSHYTYSFNENGTLDSENEYYTDEDGEWGPYTVNYTYYKYAASKGLELGVPATNTQAAPAKHVARAFTFLRRHRK